MNKYFIIILFIFFNFSTVHSNTNNNLSKIEVNLEDTRALNRGANIFFTKCQGCHSLKYIRYYDLANGINLNDTFDKSTSEVIEKYFGHSVNFINEHDQIETSMSKENGVQWFGKMPPDLSLSSRYRGKDWLYTYFKTFYKDENRPWGVNNLVYPDVGMPHILLNEQGIQILKDDFNDILKLEDKLISIENGNIEDYDRMVRDLVTFLCYVGEPTKTEREFLGFKVVIFMGVLTLFLYWLKSEYWKDIK